MFSKYQTTCMCVRTAKAYVLGTGARMTVKWKFCSYCNTRLGNFRHQQLSQIGTEKGFQ